MANNNLKEIPIVFSVDDNYAPFLAVALTSILENSSKENFYKFFVLNTGISEEHIKRLSAYNTPNSSIEFVNVVDRLNSICYKLHLRDYYTQTIYFRFFIPALFSQYKKILYLDCDVVLLQDVASLYNVELGNNVIAAIHEETMSNVKVFGDYSEEFLDVPKMEYFNSGILLINTERYMELDIEGGFIKLLAEHKFEVAPDQDYLNVLCSGNVKYLDIGWNKTPFKNIEFNREDLKLVHYKLNFKPWHYDDVLYGEYFWDFASRTSYYNELIDMQKSFTDLDKKNDEIAYKKLQQTAQDYINCARNYKKMKLGII
ncbi:MAG: glycosyltransferase family 8 protein [Clostridia bacterium]|nr:glycosyltransferase family 8 protein [Clostridia bacterium]